MIGRLLLLALTLTSCCPVPEPAAAAPSEPPNYIFLYARLHETQPKETAEDQYLPNIKEAFADLEATFGIEEIRGTEDTVEFIGINVTITAPESETEALENRLMDTLRLSGAPYATQIFIVTP